MILEITYAIHVRAALRSGRWEMCARHAARRTASGTGLVSQDRMRNYTRFVGLFCGTVLTCTEIMGNLHGNYQDQISVKGDFDTFGQTFS